MKLRLVEHWWTLLWGASSNWTVTVASFLIGAIMQWHMAVFAFLAFVPWLWGQVLAGGLVLAVLIAGPTILSRITHQDKLQAKVEEKKQQAQAHTPEGIAA